MNIYLQLISANIISSKYVTWYKNIITSALNRANSRRAAKILFSDVAGHHILPKCMCSSQGQINDKKNIVFLNVREHFIVHMLLVKMFPNNNKLGFSAAWFRGFEKITSRQYETLQNIASKVVSENNTGKIPWNKGLTKNTDDRLARLSSIMPELKVGSIPWNKGLNKNTDTRIIPTNSGYNLIKYAEEFKKENNRHWNTGMIVCKHYDGTIERVSVTDSRIQSGELKHMSAGLLTGDNNPAKRADVRNIISAKKLNQPKKHCEHCNRDIDPANFAKWHGEKCKAK